MKVKIISLLVLVFSIAYSSAKAQTEHLRFMDIPIDGTLPTFCKLLDQKLGTKLIKGFKAKPKYLRKLYPFASSETVYDGEKAYLTINAHEIDKPVHQVHLLMDNPSNPKELYKKISSELKKKYVKDKKNVEFQKANGTEMIIITVIGENNKPIGRIQASISEGNYKETVGSSTSTGSNFGISTPIGSTGISVGSGVSSGSSFGNTTTFDVHKISISITYVDLTNSKGGSKLEL